MPTTAVCQFRQRLEYLTSPDYHRARGVHFGLMVCCIGAAIIIVLCYLAIIELQDPKASPFPHLRQDRPLISDALKLLGLLLICTGLALEKLIYGALSMVIIAFLWVTASDIFRNVAQSVQAAQQLQVSDVQLLV